MINCVDSFGKTDFRPYLNLFTVPTLVRYGIADKTMPVDITGRAALQVQN